MVLHSVRDRARSAGRRWAVACALMACVATTGAVIGVAPSDARSAATASAAAASPITEFVLQTGPEERVYGPTGLVDFPYFSEKTASGKLIGFISNNDSYRTTSNGNKKIHSPKLILKRGPAGSFDKCGAWLIGSLYKKTASHWYGLYHAEAAGRGDDNRCIFSDDSVVASIGLAESRDGGLTWRKRGKVLTQDQRLTGPKTEDATMGRVIRIDQYLYLYYAASAYGEGTTRQLHVARASVDNPTSWHKYSCTSIVGHTSCDWNQPGIGGKSTPINLIDPMARVIIPNEYLDHYVALYASGTRGFRLWVSNEPINHAGDGQGTPPPMDWAGSVPFYPAVSSQNDPWVDQWGTRTKRSKQLYAYPSIVSANGDSDMSGQTFYIYYVKLFPGGDFPERYLMRRKVTLVKTASTQLSRVALTTYFRRSDGRRRTSTERPIENSFRAKSQNGYLSGEPATGFHDVFECVRRGDFRLRVTKCSTGESQYRRVGWISPVATDVATIPIYRCYNRAKKNHFASTDDRCLGFRREALLGYGLPSITP